MLDPKQQILHEAWCRLSRDHGGLPPRKAFDPIEYPRALSTVILCEVTPQNALCFRLVGTDMVEAWGADFTGRHLHDIMQGDYHDFIRGLFDEAIDKRSPIFSHSRFQWDRGRSLDTKRLMLPFARNEAPQEFGFVLVSQVFDYSKTGPGDPLIKSLVGREFVEVARQELAGAHH